MNRHAVTVRTRFEAGHRLAHLPGKCTNLHGHSWTAHITLSADQLDADDLVTDFTGIKNAVQHYLDVHLDHGMLLSAADPYAAQFADDGLKVYRFGADPHTEGLSHPTVEAVAEMITRLAVHLADVADIGAHVERVAVSETENNTAEVRR